jgi:exodeoxyribonuclease VII large subunit
MSEPSLQPISQTNAWIRTIVEQVTLQEPLLLSGTISYMHESTLGHTYFDIAQDDFSIPCMMPSRIANLLGFKLYKGLEVVVYGKIRVYEKNAKLQLMVDELRLLHEDQRLPDESGLKQLEEAGLWPRPKRNLPTSIRAIGLVTGRNSDARYDFENTYREHQGTAAIHPKYVRLEGDGAASDIAEAIQFLNRQRNVDVIVLTRGGGRSEDLAVFDDFQILEAICKSTIPVVTGIGHTKDMTLSDQVADISRITPTATATYLAEYNRTADTPTASAVSQAVVPSVQPGANRVLPYVIGLCIVLAIAVLILLFMR